MLVTNTDLPAAGVIERYKALADIERGFCVLKSDIEIAPVHHRLPERIRAHALICFLALLLRRVMRMRLKASASPLSPQRALALLRQIQQLQVKIDHRPTTRTSQINAEQRGLLQQLNLPAPRSPPRRSDKSAIHAQRNQPLTAAAAELGVEATAPVAMELESQRTSAKHTHTYPQRRRPAKSKMQAAASATTAKLTDHRVTQAPEKPTRNDTSPHLDDCGSTSDRLKAR